MTHLLFLETLSPLHAGTGQSTGAVDLPIARERASNLPYQPGSSIKGSLRDRAANSKQFDKKAVTAIFGPETAEAAEHAGSLAFGDAGLLLLPVRSVAGTFALVTSPLLLLRLLRDARSAGPALNALAEATAELARTAQHPGLGISKSEKCLLAAGTSLEAQVGPSRRVVLEDFDLEPVRTPQPDDQASKFADALAAQLYPANNDPWRAFLKQRLCIVHDDLMTYLAQHGTDVVTRVAIDDDSKTVKKGQLWTEENLPVGTVLLAIAEPMPNAKAGLDLADIAKHLKGLTEQPIQLGGKATVGRGRCQLRVVGGAV
jgi:CRISPR-associated protein Cmr4